MVKWISIGFVLIIVGIGSIMVTSSLDSSKSTKTGYYCGYCGKSLGTSYYDYFNGEYACRNCSKKYRN